MKKNNIRHPRWMIIGIALVILTLILAIVAIIEMCLSHNHDMKVQSYKINLFAKQRKQARLNFLKEFNIKQGSPSKENYVLLDDFGKKKKKYWNVSQQNKKHNIDKNYHKYSGHRYKDRRRTESKRF
jgi:hypothetical protein